MPSRVAMITWLDSDPVDPGYGRPGFSPVDPGYGRPAWGPVDPGYGHGAGLHPSTGPVYPPGHPSAGLPVAPVYPSHGLPGEGGEPVDPAWGYSPHLGWFVVYCKGGTKPDNALPETPEPKV
jgi:hypothetical protein